MDNLERMLAAIGHMARLSEIVLIVGDRGYVIWRAK